jgi:UDP-2,3-diacylglucosamine hydrolase
MTALPVLRLEAQSAWVWADLHLQAERPTEIQAFADSLAEVPVGLECVLILGDLFDAWTGPEMWCAAPFLALTEAFKKLSEGGVQVILIRGNRDVLMEPTDTAKVGAQLADEVLWAGESHLLISHGDEYCLRDLAYQRLRRTLRRPWLRRFLRFLPVPIRQWIARKMRKRSTEAIARKPLDSMALDEAAICQALRENGAQKALIGHLHAAELRVLEGEFELEVLAAWQPGQTALELA